MAIQVLSQFTRVGEKNYPLIEDTDQKGGFQVVATTQLRDAVPSSLRKEGMHVFVVADTTVYRLEADLLTWTAGALGGVGGSSQGSYDCPNTVAVLDAMYLSGAGTADRADADDPVKQPLIGFVKSKPTDTTAVIVYGGELGGFQNLVPKDTYYLGLQPGTITNDVSGYPQGSVVQKVGFAKSSAVLVVMVDRDFTIL